MYETAWLRGGNDAINGRDDCPYREGSPRAEAWLKGYSLQQTVKEIDGIGEGEQNGK